MGDSQKIIRGFLGGIALVDMTGQSEHGREYSGLYCPLAPISFLKLSSFFFWYIKDGTKI